MFIALTVAANAPAAPPAQAARAKERLREVLRASADTANGARLFAICTECHGAQGEGNASGWPPQIAGQHTRVIAKQLIDFRTGLRWYDPMERIAGPHVLQRTQDIADVAAYVAGLAPSSATTPGPGRRLEQGAELYVRPCESCHGAQGEGNDERFVCARGGAAVRVSAAPAAGHARGAAAEHAGTAPAADRELLGRRVGKSCGLYGAPRRCYTAVAHGRLADVPEWLSRRSP